jgi:hypothetical protein
MKVSRSEMAPLPRAMLHGHGEGGSSLAWSTRKRSATVDRQLIGTGVAAGFGSLDAIVRQPIEVATACVIPWPCTPSPSGHLKHGCRVSSV